MIIADANLVAYYYLPGASQSLAHEVLKKDPTWLVPPIFSSEFRNILLGYVRVKNLAKKDAIDIAARVEMVFNRQTRAVSSSQVMDVACESGCSAYDAEYVCLAKMLNVHLVTNDKFLLKAFPKIAMSLERFSKDGKE